MHSESGLLHVYSLLFSFLRFSPRFSPPHVAEITGPRVNCFKLGTHATRNTAQYLLRVINLYSRAARVILIASGWSNEATKQRSNGMLALKSLYQDDFDNTKNQSRLYLSADWTTSRSVRRNKLVRWNSTLRKRYRKMHLRFGIARRTVQRNL